MTGTAGSIAVPLLLALAALVAVLCCLALVVMKGFYDKLHYLAPAAVLSTAAVVAAIFVQEKGATPRIKGLLVLAVLVIGNPVITNAAARAQFFRARREQSPQQKGS